MMAKQQEGPAAQSLIIYLRDIFDKQPKASFKMDAGDQKTKLGDVLVYFQPFVDPAGSIGVISSHADKMVRPGIDKDANTLVSEIYPEGSGDIMWLNSSSLNPLPSFMQLCYIVACYKKQLKWPLWIPEMSFRSDPDANKGDVDPFNLQRLGSWDEFGRGPVNPPADMNNSMHNLIIISVLRPDGTRLRKCTNATQYVRALRTTAKDHVLQLDLTPVCVAKFLKFFSQEEYQLPLGGMCEFVISSNGNDVNLDLTYHDILFL